MLPLPSTASKAWLVNWCGHQVGGVAVASDRVLKLVSRMNSSGAMITSASRTSTTYRSHGRPRRGEPSDPPRAAGGAV